MTIDSHSLQPQNFRMKVQVVLVSCCILEGGPSLGWVLEAVIGPLKFILEAIREAHVHARAGA